MASGKLSQLLKVHKRATHFICLPLCNAKSKAHLDSLYQMLIKDETTMGLPQKVFRLPSSFSIKVCRLRIENPGGVRAVVNMLCNLSVRDLLHPKSHTQSPGVEHQTSVLPLNCRMKGLVSAGNSTSDYPSSTAYRIDCISDEPTQWQESMMRNLHQKLSSIEGVACPPMHPKALYRTLGPNIINIAYSRKYDTFPEQLGHIVTT